MDILLSSLEKFKTGGGDIFILSDDQSEDIVNNTATINGESTRYAEVLGGKWAIAKDHASVKLAMQKNSYTRNFWMGLFVVFYQGEYRRVDLQIGSCKTCKWQGWTATPLRFDLYVGNTDEASALFDEAKQLTALRCPQCDGQLDKHAIWIGEKVRET